MATMLAMLIQTVTTQRVLIFVLARKDTLEMDSHVKVNKSSPHYLKKAALHRNNCPWKLALLLKTCCHAPLSYFYYHTFCIMLLDIDECSNGSHDCDVNANCTNTNGSHSCTCKEGYTGKGESCQGKIRLDLKKKKQNNCSSLIIALLSEKLAEEFFFSIQLPIANLLCSQILINATMIFVMLMLTVPTLMVLIIASVSKDALEMDSLANVD